VLEVLVLQGFPPQGVSWPKAAESDPFRPQKVHEKCTAAPPPHFILGQPTAAAEA